ncbi:hypothetical protein BH23GEM4_BH23GEM4_10680 [soil metagenome]
MELQPGAADCIPRANQQLSGGDYGNDPATRRQLIPYGAGDLLV